MSDASPGSNLPAPLPRWPVMVATLAVAGIYITLPPHLRFYLGPGWSLAVLVGVLSLFAFLTYHGGRYHLNQMFGYLAVGAETIALLISVVSLVKTLPAHRTSPIELLRDAGVLYLSNILIFAVWYWRLDAGGPHIRDARPVIKPAHFFFRK